MERKKAQESIKHALDIGDWYDLTHIVKADISGYALYYLANLAIKQHDQLKHINEIATEGKQ